MAQISLQAAKRCARVVREAAERMGIPRPEAPVEVRDAAEKAERMIEHLRSFVSRVPAGVRDAAHGKRLKVEAAEVIRMWRAMMRTKDDEVEVVMRFVAAVDYAAGITDDCNRARLARRTFRARFLAYDEPEIEADFADAIAAWRLRAGKWVRLLEIVERVFGRQRYDSGEALREEYKRWRSKLKNKA